MILLTCRITILPYCYAKEVNYRMKQYTRISDMGIDWDAIIHGAGWDGVSDSENAVNNINTWTQWLVDLIAIVKSFIEAFMSINDSNG